MGLLPGIPILEQVEGLKGKWEPLDVCPRWTAQLKKGTEMVIKKKSIKTGRPGCYKHLEKEGEQSFWPRQNGPELVGRRGGKGGSPHADLPFSGCLRERGDRTGRKNELST